MKGQYTIGKGIPSWSNGETQNITFVVTEDCNLRCKYCYITHKSSNKRMNFKVAKKFIDYLFTDNVRKGDAVILEFFGGEPLLEIDLIDKITDYFKIKSYKMGHKWAWNYILNICTNGVKYNDEIVQKYFRKNKGKLSVTITLDGNKEKHDLQRVFPDGAGSYDIIIKNVPKWISIFNPSTKVTFASDDLIYLKDSIINLWNLGIIDVAANVVFENVWKEGDDVIYENQLMQLADYIIDEKLYNTYKCTLFDEQIGYPYIKDELKQTYCGAGKMLALGPDGKIYPCIRYKDYSLNNKNEWIFGNIDKGIDMERIRPFLLASNELQSDSECINCVIATGCSFCQGFNYDEAKSPTNFYRAKYICKMHKARVRANNYYFSRLFNEFNIEKEIKRGNKKELYFLLSSDYVTYCQTSNVIYRNEVMNENDLIKGLEYAHHNFFDIIFVHSNNIFEFKEYKEFKNHFIKHIIPIKFYDNAKILKNVTWVIDKKTISYLTEKINNCILNIDENDIGNLINYINTISNMTNRININVLDLNEKFDYDLYKTQLKELKKIILNIKNKTGKLLEINVITDLLYVDIHDNCKAGDKSFSLGPDGNLYTCPAFYSKSKQYAIGNLESGIDNLIDGHLYDIKYNPLCRKCKAYQCINCIYLNHSSTNEFNVSPSYQCKKANVEKKITYELSLELNQNNYKKIDYPKNLDPILEEMDKVGFQQGIYKNKA